MSLSKCKCWYSNNCLHFLKRAPTFGKSAASFYHQVAAWIPDMFWIFYLVKNHKIANNSTTAEDREKNGHKFRTQRILEMFWF
jgi:hypothetical protein